MLVTKLLMQFHTSQKQHILSIAGEKRTEKRTRHFHFKSLNHINVSQNSHNKSQRPCTYINDAFAEEYILCISAPNNLLYQFLNNRSLEPPQLAASNYLLGFELCFNCQKDSANNSSLACTLIISYRRWCDCEPSIETINHSINHQQ